jgi:hypothetical protein
VKSVESSSELQPLTIAFGALAVVLLVISVVLFVLLCSARRTNRMLLSQQNNASAKKSSIDESSTRPSSQYGQISAVAKIGTDYSSGIELASSNNNNNNSNYATGFH